VDDDGDYVPLRTDLSGMVPHTPRELSPGGISGRLELTAAVPSHLSFCPSKPSFNDEIFAVSNRISCCEYFVLEKEWMRGPEDYGDIKCPKSTCMRKLGIYNCK